MKGHIKTTGIPYRSDQRFSCSAPININYIFLLWWELNHCKMVLWTPNQFSGPQRFYNQWYWILVRYLIFPKGCISKTSSWSYGWEQWFFLKSSLSLKCTVVYTWPGISLHCGKSPKNEWTKRKALKEHCKTLALGKAVIVHCFPVNFSAICDEGIEIVLLITASDYYLASTRALQIGYLSCYFQWEC